MGTLESLPPEILFHILSYLDPFRALPTITGSPLTGVAATSKHLNSVVEEYARGLLKQHAHINISKAQAKKSASCHRRKWIKWISGTCQICKKKSYRKAILDPRLTCCAGCDKKIPKMTMTNAITKHGLSKLDLFTPNRLHPNLPPLTVGEYICMGGTTIMISELDVLARKQLIHGLLGESVLETAALRRRVAAHDRIIEALDITFRNGRWVKAYKFQLDSEGKVKKSLRTVEDRQKYAKEGLEKEWSMLGMGAKSKDTAIVVD